MWLCLRRWESTCGIISDALWIIPIWDPSKGRKKTLLFSLCLPSREQMDARAYRKGEQVSVTRRCFAALVDFAVMLVALAALTWRLPSVMPSGRPVAMAAWLFGCYAVGIVGYFVLGTWLGGGRTVGKGAFAPAPDGPAKRRPSQTVAVRGALWGFCTWW